MTVVKSFLDPSGPINSGTLRAISVTTPEKSIVNATAPAPCGGLNEVRFACDAAVMGALGKVIPRRMTGDVRGTSNHTYIGGTGSIFYEYPSGGTGGWSEADGNTAVRAFNEGENVSIQSAEVVETLYPMRILRNEVRPDSGGPGTFRGGCGLIREVEILTSGTRLSVLSDRNIIPPAGVNGGASGAPNRYTVRRNGRTFMPSEFPGKIANFELRVGDVVVMESSGGGGYGNPTRRGSARIEADLADGYVTETGVCPYREEAPLVSLVTDRALLSTQCRLASDVADGLRAAPGDLIEISPELGPSIRFWVAAIDASLNAGSVSIPSSILESNAVSIRLLSNFSRLSATALRSVS
jgi:N-methylhydantoinase B/oxoprolinase/acetone carboxylase alpha subunit